MNTEARVEVDCLRSRTLILQLTDEYHTRQKTVMARVLAEARSEVPFTVRIAYFSDMSVRFEAVRKIGYAIKAPNVDALENLKMEDRKQEETYKNAGTAHPIERSAPE